MAYHDGLFANQQKLGRHSFYDSLAVQTGVRDHAAFGRCVDNQKTASIINAGKALRQKLGVTGIPTFLINGTLVSGALPEARLEELVKNKLAEAGK